MTPANAEGATNAPTGAGRHWGSPLPGSDPLTRGSGGQVVEPLLPQPGGVEGLAPDVEAVHSCHPAVHHRVDPCHRLTQLHATRPPLCFDATEEDDAVVQIDNLLDLEDPLVCLLVLGARRPAPPPPPPSWRPIRTWLGPFVLLSAYVGTCFLYTSAQPDRPRPAPVTTRVWISIPDFDFDF
jgi:hypothetical protein